MYGCQECSVSFLKLKEENDFMSLSLRQGSQDLLTLFSSIKQALLPLPLLPILLNFRTSISKLFRMLVPIARWDVRVKFYFSFCCMQTKVCIWLYCVK